MLTAIAGILTKTFFIIFLGNLTALPLTAKHVIAVKAQMLIKSTQRHTTLAGNLSLRHVGCSVKPYGLCILIKAFGPDAPMNTIAEAETATQLLSPQQHVGKVHPHEIGQSSGIKRELARHL